MMSPTKKELKDIKSLRSRKGRRTHGRFVAEGVRLLEEALRHRVDPVLLLCAPAVLSERGGAVVQRFRSRQVAVCEVSARTLSSASDTVTSQGLLGVFELPTRTVEQLLHREYRRVLLCEAISDPGNLGTLLRVALAFRFEAVLLVGRCADPYAPKVVRASAGAVFGVMIVRVEPSQLVEFKTRGKYRLVAADVGYAKAGEEPADLASPRLILAIGSEAEGLSDPILALADSRWRLDHEDCVDSLNAAVAGAIMMQRIYRYNKGKGH